MEMICGRFRRHLLVENTQSGVMWCGRYVLASLFPWLAPYGVLRL